MGRRGRTRHQRARVARSPGWVALRRAERPGALGAIDWLLWGSKSNPSKPGTVAHRAYELGYAEEKQRTPRPSVTRLEDRKRG